MIKVASLTRSRLRLSSFGGQTVIGRHQQLARLLTARLGDDNIALMLAEPQVNAASDEIAWYTSRPGPVLPLPQVPEPARTACIERRDGYLARLRGLIDEFRGNAVNQSSVDADTLTAVLTIPDEDVAFYAVEEPADALLPPEQRRYHPLIVGWGCQWSSPDRQPVNLTTLAKAAPAAAAFSPSPAAAETAPPPPAQPGTAGPAAAPVAVERAGLFPTWLLWLINGVLLASVVFFLLRGCEPAVPVTVTAPAPAPAAAPPAPAEPPAGEAALRREIAQLEAALAEKSRQCVPPEPPKPAPLPEPPKPEPPKPEPPPAPPPVPPPPKPEPVEKGEELVIPESAKKENDLSFLEGCWSSYTGLRSTVENKEIGHLYCFNGAGKGTVTVKFIGSSRVCSGPAMATFSGDRLMINVPRGASCPSGSRSFNPWTVSCEARGGNAHCRGLNKDGDPFGVSLKRN